MDRKTKASLLALLAFFCMALFGIATKLALEQTSAFWVSFFAYLTGTLILTPYIAMQGGSYLRSQQYALLINRAFFGTLASFLYTISINFIPIVNATLLFNTAPVFIPLLSVLLLHKRLEKTLWLAVFIGFLGICFIIKPTKELFEQPGNLIGLASGFSLAIAYLSMKLLTNTDPGIRIIFYYLGLGTLFQLPLLFFAGPLPEMHGIFYAIISGALLLIAQLSLVNAYRFADASYVGVYQYSTIVFVGLLEWILWGKIPTPLDLIGIVLVIFAGISIIKKRT